MTPADYEDAQWALSQIPDPVVDTEDFEPLDVEDLQTISEDICRVVWWLRGLGITVDPWALWLEDEPPEDPSFSADKYEVSGRCHYENCWIGLNESSAQRALEVLCHEAGHMLSYRHLQDLYPDPEDLPYNQEHLAYLYGWGVIRFLGLGHRISKDQWKEHHRDIFEQLRGGS